ncbi:MAG: hypothetical protein ACPGZP_09605 [Panacagrimonas sp.]
MHKWVLALATAVSMFLAACGGHGGKIEDSSDTTARSEAVAGPLDALQDPVSEQVLGQLAGAAAGTPLEGAVTQLDHVVVDDILEILDAYAVALADTVAAGGDIDSAVAAFTEAGAVTQDKLFDLVADLQSLFVALAGGEVPEDGLPVLGADGGNPLVGTPLEALGEAGLFDSFALLQAGLAGLGASGDDLDLTALSDLYHDFAQTFSTALSVTPPQAQDAPVLGPLLETLETAVTDLDTTLALVSDYTEMGDEGAIGSALEVTLNNLLNNLLIEVLPVGLYEDQIGSTDLSDGIRAAVDGLVAPLAAGAGDGADQLTAVLDGPLAPLLDPVENIVLPELLSPLQAVLAQFGPSGNVLEDVLNLLPGLLLPAASNPIPGILNRLQASTGGCVLLVLICDL